MRAPSRKPVCSRVPAVAILNASMDPEARGTADVTERKKPVADQETPSTAQDASVVEEGVDDVAGETPATDAPEAGRGPGLDDTGDATPLGGVPMEPTVERARRLQEQLDEAQDRHLRLAAEFDNFRKRVARERVELSDRAQAALVARLLDVVDDVDRLEETASASATPEALAEGMVLVARKLRKELEAAGLTRIDPVDQPFNPGQHEAVAATPTTDPAADQRVAATFQVGYQFKGTLVRPARVQVYTAQGTV